MDVLCANIDTSLLSSIQASMSSFDRACHGGPLCLFYLLREWFPQAEFAVDQIIVMVPKVNISSQFQDDVPKCVQVIRAALDFVRNVRHSNGQSPLPANYVSKVVPVFKTTSNDEFNNQFLHFASTIRLQSLHTYQQAYAPVSDSDNLMFLLRFASELYSSMTSEGKWTTQQPWQSTFKLVTQDGVTLPFLHWFN